MKRSNSEISMGILTKMATFSLLLFMANNGLKINRKNISPNLNYREASEKENMVGIILKRILEKQNITVEYEAVELICFPVSDDEKETTNPDFYFLFAGIHFFVEVGGKSNDTIHKKKQMSVVKNGTERKGKKSDILYVQLNNDDINKLKKIKKIEDLIMFLRTREKSFEFFNAK